MSYRAMQQHWCSLRRILHGKKVCWASPHGKGTFVSSPIGKPQQLLWGYSDLCQHKSKQPHVGKSGQGRGMAVATATIPAPLPPISWTWSAPSSSSLPHYTHMPFPTPSLTHRVSACSGGHQLSTIASSPFHWHYEPRCYLQLFVTCSYLQFELCLFILLVEDLIVLHHQIRKWIRM